MAWRLQDRISQSVEMLEAYKLVMKYLTATQAWLLFFQKFLNPEISRKYCQKPYLYGVFWLNVSKKARIYLKTITFWSIFIFLYSYLS